jgi:uncharacterized metal-binding protein YceD (DUF177 family)
MKLPMQQIGQKGKRISIDSQRDEFDFFQSTWLLPTIEEHKLTPDSFQAELFLEKNFDNSVKGKVTLKFRPMVECVRCLKPERVQIENTFEALFTGQNEQPVGEERDLKDLNVYEVLGTDLPMDEFLLDAIHNGLPERHLCQPHCLGLCTGCGANKNSELCACVTSAPFH